MLALFGACLKPILLMTTPMGEWLPNFWLIIAAGLVTYLTRIFGFMVIERIGALHPRIEAGLNAVPAAVLTTIFVPPALTQGWPEFLAMVIAFGFAFRLGVIPVLLIGMAAYWVLRTIF